jgi:co-chaperonin GroES (HSP10)
MGTRLLVKRIEQAKPDTQLIVIPDTVQDKPSIFAIVFAIGKLVHGGVEVGDIVILKDFTGAPALVQLPGDEQQTECIIVNEDDVLAVVHDGFAGLGKKSE